MLRQKARPCYDPEELTRGTRPSLRRAFQQPRLVQIERKNRQLEIGRARVLFVEEQYADIFLAYVDFGRILLPGPRHHANALVVELALEIGIELLDVGSDGGGIAQGNFHFEIV